MSKKYDVLVDSVMELVGTKENVRFFTHCITRLRFNVKDKGAVNVEKIKTLPGVIGAQWSGDQLQIIIGQDVDKVYNLICQKYGFVQEKTIDENPGDASQKKKFSINTLFDTLSACVVPVLPALCGSGILKGVLLMLRLMGGVATDSALYIILNAVSDAPFYFLPFLVAYGAAKKFNTSVTLSMVVAGVYLHPSITALSGSALNLFGWNINIVSYSSTIFPILISIWVMSYLNRWLEAKIPAAFRFVFAPTITLLIMTFLSLGIIGPLGYNIGYYVGKAVSAIFDASPIIGGFVLGAIRPVVILTGMQTAFTPIITNNLATLGYDMLSPVHTTAAMAAAGVCLGAFLRAKKQEDRENYMSFFISGFIGVTEPALYGLVFRFKNQLIALMASGAISGAVVSALGAKNGAGIPMWIAFAAYGETMPALFIGLAVALVTGVAFSYVLGLGSELKRK